MSPQNDLERAIDANRCWKSQHIYVVSDNVIGKCCSNERIGRHEYEMGLFLREHDVSVPRMHGFLPLDVRLRNGEEVKKWYILMQLVHGESITDTSGPDRRKAMHQYKQELRKVLDLGIYPKDYDWGGNSLFDRKQGKLYLIDFEFWEKEGDERLLKSIYEQLERNIIFFRLSQD